VQVFGLDGRQLLDAAHVVDAKANSLTPVPSVNIKQLVDAHGMVIVSLRLRDLAGKPYSDNTYWQGKDDASHQLLNALPQQRLKLSAASSNVGDERVVAVLLENDGKVPVLATKLTLVDHMGARILPSRYSDNYITVMPGEPRRVLISYPAKLGTRATVNLRGWNARPTSVKVRDAGTASTQPYIPTPANTPAPRVESVDIKLPAR
jgi:hypothetical protein